MNREQISNLITDMILNNASSDNIMRAIEYSIKIIDTEKSK